MLELALPIYKLNLTYAQKLVADVPDEQFCAQPVSGRVLNHPAFVLGHLAWVSKRALGYVAQGAPSDVEGADLFGMGAVPQADRSRYPSKERLLGDLETAHAALAAAVSKARPEVLQQPAAERIRARFPTVEHLLLHMLTSHEATHLGQLSAWRRALGLPPTS
ncbi:MAG TPA: DinB family protein [Gemmataceae bacterium]|nr:DinB family protein [Gemmataceae bacterium]